MGGYRILMLGNQWGDQGNDKERGGGLYAEAL